MYPRGASWDSLDRIFITIVLGAGFTVKAEGGVIEAVAAFSLYSMMTYTAAFILIGEELGWRAFLYDKLEKLAGLHGSIIIGGIIWGLWHAPLTCIGHNFGTDYPGFPYVGIFKMCIFCTLLGIMLTYVTEMSGSVWPAAFMHAIFNSSPSILIGFINQDLSPDTILGRNAGFTGMVFALLAVDILIMVKWKKSGKEGK